ncbi:uncharacterized protein F5891DRAFT_957732, partial [Suillus fuscotomentosus]
VLLLQVAWFVMQLITRAIYHLETTQLEVGTLAFAVLNFLTYAAWWDKPLNVQCPHPVHWKSTNSESTSTDSNSASTDSNSTVTPECYIGCVCTSTIIPLLIMSALVSVKKIKSLNLGSSLQSSGKPSQGKIT